MIQAGIETRQKLHSCTLTWAYDFSALIMFCLRSPISRGLAAASVRLVTLVSLGECLECISAW